MKFKVPKFKVASKVLAACVLVFAVFGIFIHQHVPAINASFGLIRAGQSLSQNHGNALFFSSPCFFI
jgi:hypothetical protein